MQIGIAGLGRMGAAMAARLMEVGHTLAVWNRTPEKAKPLTDAGAKLVDTPEDLAEHSDVIITILTDANAVDHVYNGEQGLLAGDVTGHWDWQGGRIQASVDDDLRVLLAYGPSFRLMVAHGYSDMVTPYAMTRYILDHMPAFDPPGRVQLKLYRGGHMLYLDPESRKAFSTDAAAFYRSGE